MDYIAEPATDMSHTSDWPLPADSLRLPIPAALLEKLAVHPLSRDLYPTSLGHYRRARDHRMSRERHDEHLLIYCSEGQGLLRVREGEAREGSLDLDGLHAYMREHLHARLELERLAAFCNLSKFHFVSRYKAITGRTPIQHFLHLKIEYACQLLDSSDQSVARVGQAVGYDDSYYFSRLFSKVMGLSPSAYRQRVRQGEGGA